MTIEIKNLTYYYTKDRPGLKDLNLTIRPGLKTAIIGLNGSGKSTLLGHLNGMKFPNTGSVTVNDIPVEKNTLRKIRSMVGYIFDFPDHQLFSTSVYKDLEFGLDNYQFSEEEKATRIQNISKVLGIRKLHDYPPFHLSLGQKKRVALAGVMVLDPSVLVMDEPFSGLDYNTVKDLCAYLDRWLDSAKSLVFSSHDTDLVYEWADDVLVLNEGRLVLGGPKEEVMTNPKTYSFGLKKPYLYELFEDSKTRPKNLDEAKKYLKRGNYEKID